MKSFDRNRFGQFGIGRKAWSFRPHDGGLVKRTLFALMIVVLAANAQAGTKWYRNVGEAQKEAKAKNQLIFVDLFADWCGWCHRMEQEVFPSETFQKATDKLVLLRLDTEDGGEGTRIAQQLGVSQLPTFLLVTHDLMVAGVISGYAPADRFVAQMRIQEKKYVDFQKELAAEPKADPARRLDLARQLNSRNGFVLAEQRLTKLVAEKKLPADKVGEAYYQLAVSQASQKKYDAAMKNLGVITSGGKAGDVVERARFLKAQLYLEQGKFASALAELKSFKQTFPGSPLTGAVNRLLPQVEQAASAKK